jgi:hypothetical protein
MNHLHDNCLNDLRRVLAGEKPEPEREPWVDIRVHIGEKTLTFDYVSGIRIDAKTGALTFEQADGTLFFVPNVDFWTTHVCDQW